MPLMSNIHRQLIRRPRTLRTLVAVTVAGTLTAIGAMTPVPAAASTGASARVVGTVVSFATDRPVAGATVRLPDQGLVTRSGADGTFAFATPVRAAHPYTRLKAVVTAAGYGSWTVRGIPLYPNQTLELYAELRTNDWTHTATPPSERSDADAQRTRTAAALTGKTCTGWDHKLMPPPTIKVFDPTSSKGKAYDFYFYVTHVLPSEWIPSWDADALGAGAIAAKTYAAFRAMSGNARTDGPDCYDILNGTSDQVFDPTYSYPTTDAAVYSAMGSILLRDGALFLAQYWSGSDANSVLDWKKCEYVDQDPFVGRMSQWGTQACADPDSINADPPLTNPPMVWPDIARVFYAGTNWRYPKDILLNPSFDAEVGTDPWSAGSNASIKLSDSKPYQGAFRLKVAPTTSGKTASVFQAVPMLGGPVTSYHAQVYLWCPASNPSDCSVKLKVKAIPDTGSTVIRSTTLLVPRDAKWHVRNFDPTPAGINHSQVQFYLSSQDIFWVDATYLDFPFGGI